MVNKPNRRASSASRQYADRRARGGGQMCHSKTKEGVRCTKAVAQGEEYCHLHRNGRPAAQARSARQGQTRVPASRFEQARSAVQPIRQAASVTSKAVTAVEA